MTQGFRDWSELWDVRSLTLVDMLTADPERSAWISRNNAGNHATPALVLELGKGVSSVS